MEAMSVDTERRRALIQSVLSPPTISLVARKEIVSPNDHQGNLQSDKPCSLCHCDRHGGSRPAGKSDVVVTETVRIMLTQTQVGVDLHEELTFCHFCLTQLQNFVTLKRDMDRLGERFVTMILGLQTLFSSSKTTVKQDAVNCEYEFDVKPDLEGRILLGEGLSCLEEGSMHPSNIHTGTGDMEIDPWMEEVDPVVLQNVWQTEIPKDAEVMKFENDTSRAGGSASNTLTQIDTTEPEPHVGSNFKGQGNHEGIRNTIPATRPEKECNPLICPTCNKTFTQKSNLEQHLLIHTGDKPFPCHICPRLFRQKAHLRHHLNCHLPEMERPYPCHLCPKRFPVKFRLTAHLKTHGPPSLHCGRCGEGFNYQHELKRHMNTHSIPIPFTCNPCHQSFSNVKNLEEHIVTHHKHHCNAPFK